MVLITCDETKFLGNACDKLLEESDVRFVGVINHLGNLVAGNCKIGIKPFEQGTKRKIMYTQMILSLSMDREFDESLGTVEYVTSFRKNVMITSIPRKDGLVVISSEKSINIRQLINNAKKIFEMV